MFKPTKNLVFLNDIFFGENGHRIIEEQSMHINKTICIPENHDLKQVIIQNELESINLSATNVTFVTKGEIESNFLTTLSDKPKLNNWVNTILNLLVIQFEPSRRSI